jgi:hypothetical protein
MTCHYKNQLHIVVYCENHTKIMHMLCDENEETSTVNIKGRVSINIPQPMGTKPSGL